MFPHAPDSAGSIPQAATKNQAIDLRYRGLETVALGLEFQQPWLIALRYVHRLGPVLGVPLMMAVRKVMKAWQEPLDDLRRAVDLPVDRRSCFESSVSNSRHLALFSRHFSPQALIKPYEQYHWKSCINGV